MTLDLDNTFVKPLNGAGPKKLLSDMHGIGINPPYQLLAATVDDGYIVNVGLTQEQKLMLAQRGYEIK